MTNQIAPFLFLAIPRPMRTALSSAADTALARADTGRLGERPGVMHVFALWLRTAALRENTFTRRSCAPRGTAVRSIHGARAVPIYETTSYVYCDTEHAAALFNLERPGHIHSRISNPTVAILEELRGRTGMWPRSGASIPAARRRASTYGMS